VEGHWEQNSMFVLMALTGKGLSSIDYPQHLDNRYIEGWRAGLIGGWWRLGDLTGYSMQSTLWATPDDICGRELFAEATEEWTFSAIQRENEREVGIWEWVDQVGFAVVLPDDNGPNREIYQRITRLSPVRDGPRPKMDSIRTIHGCALSQVPLGRKGK
jgi:hypothetical protein